MLGQVVEVLGRRALIISRVFVVFVSPDGERKMLSSSSFSSRTRTINTTSMLYEYEYRGVHTF